MNKPTIVPVEQFEQDFVLQGLDQDASVNIAYGLFTITIKRNDVGISIDVYPQATPTAEPLASLTAWDEDAELIFV